MSTHTLNKNILLINKASGFLKEKGVNGPEANSRQLLCCVTGKQFLELCLTDDSLTKANEPAFWKAVKERLQGIPLQYIIGSAQFYGLEFVVKKGVFIPRPETEILVDVAINKLNSTSPAGRETPDSELSVLDLGTGCGNIAISLTKTVADCKIVATEISSLTLKVADVNAAIHGVGDRIYFLISDLFKYIHKDKNFNLIVSNPPYIPTAMIKDLPFEVKEEPHIALDGAGDGLYFFRRIAKEAPNYLKDSGFLIMEMGDGQYSSVATIFRDNGFCDIEVFKDLNDKERVVSARWTR